MKKIYLIRHGETDYNRKGYIQGSGIDSHLNNTGRIQALAFYQNYGHIPFCRIYTSDLLRSKQSVKWFIDKGIPVEHYSGLNEMSWGEFEGKKVTYSQDCVFANMLNHWKSGNLNYSLNSGESPLDVAARQWEIIKIIQSRFTDKNILICMHGRAMRILLCQLLNKPLTEMDSFVHNNLGLYIVNMNKSGEFELEKANCTNHLQFINFN